MFRQRDYPREIVVGDQVWEIRFVRGIAGTATTVTLGLCDPSEHVIYIKQGLKPTERLATFVHEVLHAIEYEYNIEIAHKLVHLLDEPIAKLIIDNYLGVR